MRRVGDTLSSRQLDVAHRQHHGLPPKLIHPRLKRHARPGRGLLKEQAQHTALQQGMGHTAALLHFQLRGQAQQTRQLCNGDREQFQKIFPETGPGG
jgi:hypothetical protein